MKNKKTTESNSNQYKLLYSNLSKQQQGKLKKQTVKTLNNLHGFSKHFMDRVQEKHIKLSSELLNSIAAGDFDIIELNYTATNKLVEERIIIRSHKAIAGNQLCLVVCLNTASLVTCWNNNVNDNHATLNKHNFLNA